MESGGCNHLTLEKSAESSTATYDYLQHREGDVETSSVASADTAASKNLHKRRSKKNRMQKRRYFQAQRLAQIHGTSIDYEKAILREQYEKERFQKRYLQEISQDPSNKFTSLGG